MTFDIWTSNTQTSYLGIILIFLDNNFNLNYKIIDKLFLYIIYNLIYKYIAFKERENRHTGSYIFLLFKDI